MKTKIVLTLLAVLLLAGCHKCDVLPSGGQGVVIDTSPVDGQQLRPVKTDIELDARLLELCSVPLPDPGFTDKSTLTDVSDAKKNETKMYYDCAYRQRALIHLLAEKLHVIPKIVPLVFLGITP